MGDKCKLMRPKAARVGDKCGRQELNSCGPRHPEWETTVGDKCGRQARETSVNSYGPKHPEWQTSVKDKWKTSANSCDARHPEWETSVGDKSKLMRPKAPRVGDNCGRQV